MAEAMKYDTYKPSGIEWIGNIPKEMTGKTEHQALIKCVFQAGAYIIFSNLLNEKINRLIKMKQK